MKLIDCRHKTFVGKETSLSVHSNNSKDPRVYLKFLKKRPNNTWECFSQGEALGLHFRDILLIIGVIKGTIIESKVIGEFHGEPKHIIIRKEAENTLIIKTSENIMTFNREQTQDLFDLLNHYLQDKMPFREPKILGTERKKVSEIF